MLLLSTSSLTIFFSVLTYTMHFNIFHQVDEPSAYLDSEQRIAASKVQGPSISLIPFPSDSLQLHHSPTFPLHSSLSSSRFLLPLFSLTSSFSMPPLSFPTALLSPSSNLDLLLLLLYPFPVGHQALHHAREENSVRSGARLHHGYLPRRQVRNAVKSTISAVGDRVYQTFDS